MGAGGRYKAIPHNSKCRYGERGAADAVPQLPERCLSRKAGIVRCCHKLRIHGVGRAGTSTVFPQAVFALCDSTKTLRCLVPASRAGRFKNEKQTREKTMKIRRGPKMQYVLLFFGQHRTIPALRLKHRSGSCGTASAAPRSPYRHLELCGIAFDNYS